MSQDLIIKSNPNAPASPPILISDLGWTVPGAGGQIDIEDSENISEALASDDLRTLTQDDAFNPNGSTLILNDGVNDIPPSLVDDFLDGIENGRRNNCAATAPPTVSDDSTVGYEPCSRWVIVSGVDKGRAWINYDATPGAAGWAEITGSGGTGTGNVETIEFDFLFSDTSPKDSVETIAVGDTILNAKIEIDTAFDDLAAALQLAQVGGPSLLAQADSDPNEEGTYSNEGIEVATVLGAVRLTILPGASTQGEGRVVVTIRRA